MVDTFSPPLTLLPFQRRFLRGALRPGVRTAALSLPRGNGKSTLVAWLAHRALTPGDPLFVSGTESHMAAHSIGQARKTTFKLLREMVETADPEGLTWKVVESYQQAQVTHRETNTRISVIPSSGKAAQGLVRCPLVIADEPGAWEINGGLLLHEAIQGAQGKPGKPGSSLRSIYIGTLWPLALAPGHWWYDMVHGGSGGSRYVQAVIGRAKRWTRVAEVRRCNPLRREHPESWAVLREDHARAQGDTREAASFRNQHLNCPSTDEAVSLVETTDWERVLARSVPSASGLPIVGVDIGGARSWSAAVGVWESGRVEAVAVGPGVPDVASQERRDRVPRGTYQALVDGGSLVLAEGLRVPPVAQLVAEIAVRWGGAAGVVCDHYRVNEVRDAAPWGIETRRAGWEHSTEDIRGLRRQVADGSLGVALGSRALLTWSVGIARVKPDDRGNVRLAKDAKNNTSRDDVAQSLTLAVGALDRWLRSRPATTARCF